MISFEELHRTFNIKHFSVKFCAKLLDKYFQVPYVTFIIAIDENFHPLPLITPLWLCECSCVLKKVLLFTFLIKSQPARIMVSSTAISLFHQWLSGVAFDFSKFPWKNFVPSLAIEFKPNHISGWGLKFKNTHFWPITRTT